SIALVCAQPRVLDPGGAPAPRRDMPRTDDLAGAAGCVAAAAGVVEARRAVGVVPRRNARCGGLLPAGDSDPAGITNRPTAGAGRGDPVARAGAYPAVRLRGESAPRSGRGDAVLPSRGVVAGARGSRGA